MKTAFSIYFILLFFSNSFSQTITQKLNTFGKSLEQQECEKTVLYENDILEYWDKSFGKDTSYLAFLISFQNCNRKLGNKDIAIKQSLNSLEIATKIYGTSNIESLFYIKNIAETYSLFGELENANKYFLDHFELTKKYFNDSNVEYLYSLRQLSVNLFQKGDYAASLKYTTNCLELVEKIFGKEHSYYAVALGDLAMNYSKLGQYSKSKELNEQSLQIEEKLLGKDNIGYYISLSNLATNYSDLGNYTESRNLNEECLKFIKKNYGIDHPNYLISLNNLAQDYSNLGEYTKSMELNEESLNYYKIQYGKEHPDYARSLNNLALNYSDLGEYSKSIELNLECLRSYEKLYGKLNPNYVSCLHNLASDYTSIGDFKKSIELNQECLKIREVLIGKEHPDYLLNLNNLAVNYSYLGDFNKSKELIEECLKIYEKLFGKVNPNYAISLNNQAQNYSFLGDNNESKVLNEECLEIYQKLYGKEHPDYSLSLSNLAANYSDLGDYNRAKELNEESKNIYEKLYGNENVDYANSLNALASSYFLLENYDKSFDLSFENLTIIAMNFNNNKFGLNPNLLTEYKKKLELSFLRSLSLALISNREIIRLNNYWINLNGIISSDQQIITDALKTTNDVNLIRLSDDLKINKLQLGKWNELTYQDRIAKGYNTEQLKDEIEVIEAELSRKSKDFANSNRYFDSNDIKANLSQEEVLVDIIRLPCYNYKTNKWSDSVKYIIFITDSYNDTIPQYVIIDQGNELESELYTEYTKNTIAKNIESQEIDQISYAHFWKPIAEKIATYNKVYVSLGGVYNNINLNTLFNTETEKYLLEEKDIRIISNPRDFILNKEKEELFYTSKNVSLFGFPNYCNNSIKSIDSSNQLASSRDLNAFWIDSLSRGGMKVSLLPETKIEVEKISTTFKRNGWNVSTFIDIEACESLVKQIESPRVLHIATHGYFFENIPLDNNQNLFMGIDKQKMAQDPLLRSGLLFAGANKTLQGEQIEGENGLLSAYEASLLDLRETELVVLSACETGKGEVKNSEGVYGLRKAFADAGAQNIIMSLWKVDDKVTQEFMSRFYEIWLNEKTSIREAFNRTQLEIKAKYPQPYYWGAFILVGE